jgi:predicted ATPase/class 3 adenylate cyclase
VNREPTGPGAPAGPSAEVSTITTVFTDIEGSTRLWETDGVRMRPALAAHDALVREAVARHHGTIVKTTGDGVHAVFAAAADAVSMMVDLAQRVQDPAATTGLALKLRLGAHCGAEEWRGGDYYGRDVNRAARIMSVAHGGQLLVSQAVVDRVGPNWPAAVSARSLGRVRLRDLAEPQAVYQLLHPALRADFPALRSLEATPNNLPQQLNRFIGRQAEMAEVATLLEEHRLVTLLGLGGLGKSRLAVQLAAEVMDRFPDGVWLVELAGVEEAGMVGHVLALVLGVREEPGRQLAESLLLALSDRRAMIVLDNCEHVLAAAAQWAKRLLVHSPGLKILATSREVLHVAGEAVFAVQPLRMPVANGDGWQSEPVSGPDPQRVDQLLDHDAVRLFIDRARTAHAGFVLDAGAAEAVAAICTCLDGIPLALELAAARVRALSVRQIADRLDQRLRLLVTPDPTVAPRQRTLSALIDWSYNLLGLDDQRAFAGLSVFAGGWTLEAAEAVLPAAGLVDPEGVVERLASLVEKSLVVRDQATERYRYLETVRLFAKQQLDRLAQEAVPALLERRHAEYYLQLAEAAGGALSGPDGSRGMARLDADRDNLVAAHQRAIGGRVGPDTALRFVHALSPYWMARGRVRLAMSLGIASLGASASEIAGRHRFLALLAVGQDARLAGDHRLSATVLGEARSLAMSDGNEGDLAYSSVALGSTMLALGDEVAARECFEGALLACQGPELAKLAATAAGFLGTLDRLSGHWAAAERRYEEALARGRAAQDEDFMAVAWVNLAMVRLLGRRPEGVAAMLCDVVEIARRRQSMVLLLYALDAAAGLAVSRGDWTSLAAWLAASENLIAGTGICRDPTDEAFLKPQIEAAESALGAACFAALRGLQPGASAADVLDRLAGWLAQTGGQGTP